MQNDEGRLIRIGAIATGVWLVAVLLSTFIGGGSGEGRSLAARLIGFAGVAMPVALIWLAVWIAGALAGLRAEARQLRALLDATRTGDADVAPSRGDDLRGGVAGDGAVQPVPSQHAGTPPRPQPAAQPVVAPPARPVAPTARPAAARPIDNRQASLGLESAALPDISPYDLIHALNFPDGPEDRQAIAALRKALAHPEFARLIRAAQDVVTLLSSRGVFMDDMMAETLYPALWRRFAEGARGASVGALALNADDQALQMAAGMLRREEVFRDVAQHFLRHFDRVLDRAATEFDDEALAAFVDTRSGRAFTLLAQVTGMVGEGIPDRPQSDPEPAQED